MFECLGDVDIYGMPSESKSIRPKPYVAFAFGSRTSPEENV